MPRLRKRTLESLTGDKVDDRLDALKPRRLPLMPSSNGSGGWPMSYRADIFPDLAYNASLLGHTDKEIAKLFGVDKDTVCRWKDQHPEFALALREGGAIADGKVAKALLNCALGAEIEETSVTKDGTIIRYKKVLPPNSGAAANWLANRQPLQWAKKLHITSNNLNTNIDVSDPQQAADIYMAMVSGTLPSGED